MARRPGREKDQHSCNESTEPAQPTWPDLFCIICLVVRNCSNVNRQWVVGGLALLSDARRSGTNWHHHHHVAFLAWRGSRPTHRYPPPPHTHTSRACSIRVPSTDASLRVPVRFQKRTALDHQYLGSPRSRKACMRRLLVGGLLVPNPIPTSKPPPSPRYDVPDRARRPASWRRLGPSRLVVQSKTHPTCDFYVQSATVHNRACSRGRGGHNRLAADICLIPKRHQAKTFGLSRTRAGFSVDEATVNKVYLNAGPRCRRVGR
ncbi:hypothetical protein LX32DRAFT_180340 [Colletotrichum zoysiae]|uniref:Uncharacterized protein n=1 Tax=Colletotrichum zoysiae TaxID=1216348 RepID=A0AAD9HPC5_9PEZI|nr:hypothetical protein LX32DRAFT_180340 [Colletotrichum zoysiae]